MPLHVQDKNDFLPKLQNKKELKNTSIKIFTSTKVSGNYALVTSLSTMKQRKKIGNKTKLKL